MSREEFPVPLEPQVAPPLEVRPQRHHGGYRNKLVAAGAVGVLVTGGVLAVKKWASDALPQQVAAPDDSEIKIETVDIEPVAFDCRSFTVFDNSGSTARTKYSVAGIDMDFTGYGAVMESGRSVLQACAPEPEIKVTPTTINGKPGTEVSIDVTSMTFTSFFNEGDTKIVKSPPVMSQFGGSFIDFGSATAKATCNVLSLGQAQDKCEALDVVADWNNGNQAELDRSLRVAVLQETQTVGGSLEWTNQQAAMTDSYRRQAAEEGKDPNSVRVEFVDAAGNPTDAVPDFTRSTLDKLYDEGVLQKKGDGPDIEFSNVQAKQMPGGYQAEYPDAPSGD